MIFENKISYGFLIAIVLGVLVVGLASYSSHTTPAQAQVCGEDYFYATEETSECVTKFDGDTICASTGDIELGGKCDINNSLGLNICVTPVQTYKSCFELIGSCIDILLVSKPQVCDDEPPPEEDVPTPECREQCEKDQLSNCEDLLYCTSCKEECQKLGGTSCDSLRDCNTVEPPPEECTVNITASPSSITEGDSSTLSWSSTDAASCSGTWVEEGSVPTSDSYSVSPSNTETYTAVCYDTLGRPCSDSASITVNGVAPPPPPPPQDEGCNSTITFKAVRSDTGVEIGGFDVTHSGGSTPVGNTYNTKGTCYDDQDFTMTAPTNPPSSWGAFTFVDWDIDGSVRTSPSTSIYLDDAHTDRVATIRYEYAPLECSITFSAAGGPSGVSITHSDGKGSETRNTPFTYYTTDKYDNQNFSISAPSTVTQVNSQGDNITYDFVDWEFENGIVRTTNPTNIYLNDTYCNRTAVVTYAAQGGKTECVATGDACGAGDTCCDSGASCTGEGGVSGVCDIAVPVGAGGQCGPAARKYSASETSYSGALCDSGTPSPSIPDFPQAGGSASWTCLGQVAGADDFCTATRDAGSAGPICGDGVCDQGYENEQTCPADCSSDGSGPEPVPVEPAPVQPGPGDTIVVPKTPPGAIPPPGFVTGEGTDGPVASFSLGGKLNAGTAVSFADNSQDQGGRIVSWRWDFGDGGQSGDQNPQHTYRKNGSYIVRLQVVDNDGMVGSTRERIFVGEGSSAERRPARRLFGGNFLDALLDLFRK